MTKKTFHLDSDNRAAGYWEILLSFGWVAVFFALQLVWGVVFFFWIGPESYTQEQLADVELMAAPQRTLYAISTFGGMIAAGFNFLLFVFLYLFFFGRFQLVGLSHWGKDINLKLILISIGLIIAAMVFQTVYRLALPDIEMQKNVVLLIEAMPSDLGSKLILFTSVGLLAGITEEIIFRGFLQNAIARYLNIHLAILISAAVFGLVHAQPESLLPLMALGAAFGYIYHLTKSLRLAIALHVLNNSLALVASEFIEAEKAAASIGLLLG